MNRWLFVCACTLLASTQALAMDLQGKWGIGAGVFGNATEIAIMRGHSTRSIWALDASFDQSSEHGLPFPGDGSRRVHDIGAEFGPRYRRFTRATERLTPYVDIRLDGLFERRDDLGSPFSSTRWTAGLETGLGIGAEYFTPWSFSLALDSDLISGGFKRAHAWESGTPPGVPGSAWSTELFTHVGVAPRLLARAYF